MIKTLRLTNFRGFVDHVVEFAPFTLLTGRNNAGKTTIIEALRVVSAAQARIKSAKFEMSRHAYDKFLSGPVFRFSLKTLDFDEENIHHNYRVEEPSVIQMTLTNNCKVTVYLGDEPTERFCQLQLAGGRKINSRKDSLDPKFHQVFIMPPVGSLLVNETERDKIYLRENINGYLSYRHIRNQMADMSCEFEEFCSYLERTWDGLQVQSLDLVHSDEGSRYELHIRDGRYPAEVARLGSGLQAWIQTLWFLTRVDAGSIGVLDEPDVYLHADLQKKLIRLLGSANYRQKIIATHSIEMISDVAPEEVIEVQKAVGRSRPISTKSEVQAVLNQMGTSHHIQLSKLGSAGKVLFVEGKDHKFLGQVAAKLGKLEARQFEEVPRFAIGGMGNWQRAAMTAKVLDEASSGGLVCTLLLDRDYFDDEYLAKIVESAGKNALTVKFWERKEVENFFLDGETIWEFVQKNSNAKVDRFQIDEKLDQIVSTLFSELPAKIAQNLQMAEKKLSIPTAMAMAEKLIETKRSRGLRRRDLVSGKAVFSKLSEYTQDSFGVAVSATTVCREMKLSQVPDQMLRVVKSLCT